ncbi:MAG: sulfatase-like hydrolase/transferase [Pirellulaceae bacterium]|nr:sulfatase-like hydrolase/transferase [Pirellulaceae bacterium]
MIISDDQTYTDFGFMGNRRVHTPHLDQLAKRSTVLTHGYVPSSVCRPSLVTLLTGRYPHQHGIHFNHPPPGFGKLTRTPTINKSQYDAYRESAAKLIRDQPSLPRILANIGYRCMQTGKYWEGHYRNAGFTDGMTIAEPSGGPQGDKQLPNGDFVAHGNGDHGLTIGRETMQPIDQFIADRGDDPFFLWYAPFLPHTPHDAPAEFRELFSDRRDVKAHEKPYFAAIAQFDQTVGHVLKVLDHHHLSANTLVVFLVDNGWRPDPSRFVASRQEWDHTKTSKRAPFESGLRTPILFCWPDQSATRTHSGLVSSVDIVPTILAAAEIQTEIDFPGKNLWPTISGGEPTDTQRAVFGEIYPGDASVLGNPSRDVAYRWVRHKHLKLIIPHKHGKKSAWNDYLDGPALYDVVTDPDEETNLVGHSRYQQDVTRLQKLLDDWWTPQ